MIVEEKHAVRVHFFHQEKGLHDHGVIAPAFCCYL
jgi:hypothetical protein